MGGWIRERKKNLNERRCSSDRTAAHGWDGTVQDWTERCWIFGGVGDLMEGWAGR